MQLFAAVAARLEAYDRRLEQVVADDALWVKEPASGWPVTLRVAADGRGNTKLVASATVDKAVSRAMGSTLGRMLGMVQVVSGEDSNEVRRWSPYRLDDIERTPQEAVSWSVTTAETMLEELRAAARVAPSVGVRPSGIDSDRAASSAPAPIEAVPSPVPSLVATDAPALAKLRAELDEANTTIACLTAELEQALADAARLQEERDLAVGAREAAEAAVLASVAAAPASAPSLPADLVPQLLAVYTLQLDAGIRASTSIETLRRYLLLAPDDRRLLEELGIQLLRDDRVPDAVEILGSLGANGLTPRGAAALAEASFRYHQLPDDLEILGRVDWGMGSVAQQLKDLPSWAPRDRLLEVAEIIGQGAPPEFTGLLGAAAKVVPAGQLHELFDLWFALDLNAALDQLLIWLDSQRVGLAQEWVRQAVDLALESGDKRVERLALERLADDATEQNDAQRLLDLVRRRRDLVRLPDRRSWTVARLRDVVAIGCSDDAMEECAAITLSVLRDATDVRETDSEFELISVLERRVRPEVARQLQDERDRLRPVDITIRDVTTVSEALKAAKERFVGLVVLQEATTSAAKRGTVGVAKAREALFALGEIADRYMKGELDEGLDEALAELPGYKPLISDTAKQLRRSDYLRRLPDGRPIMLGPHCDIGGGDAGRAYFYVDRDGKRIILGQLGHLRGKRDT